MLRPHRLWALALLLSLLAACGETTPTSVATRRPPTAAVLTASPRPVAVVTATATASATPLAVSATPAAEAASATLPSPEATASATTSATPTSGACANDSEFISDLSVPDGTQVLPGQPIGKQWAVRNNGGCDWNAGYRLVLVGGNALGARSELALFPARAGANAVLDVGMVAPAEPGIYTGRWQARDPDGNLFGDRIFITIEVVAPVPPTETPVP